MKSWKANLGIFIIAYVVFVLVTVPAGVIAGMVDLPKNVKLGTVGGSLWDGRASAVQVDNDIITDVSWSINPLSLFMGSINADVKFGKARRKDDISGRGGISTDFSFKSVDLNGFILRLPAVDFVQKMQLAIPATLSGQVVFNIKQYQQAKPYCEQLEGKVTWNSAGATVYNKQVSLGQVAANLGCDKGQVTLQIKDKNPLGLQFTGLIDEKGKFSGKGFVKPDGTMATDVHNTVQTMFGPADSQGRFPLTF